MREATFIQQNRHRWQEFEKAVAHQKQVPPDRLAGLFIQVTDDLSFARTQYPESRTTRYLNALAGKIHLEIYRNRKEDNNRFIRFWKYELPEVMYASRKSLLYAFLIFLVAGLMGAISTVNDDTFVRLVLGDAYVNMTLDNIGEGNPTRVYASSSRLMMFLGIAWNNVLVSFRVFVFGVFASIGTGFFLFYNGLMVGTFITLFYNEGQLHQALPVIMLHGTMELASVVIAGAAGFAMGNALLFPGTYARLVSFRQGAVKGLKIVMGLVPFFLLAAFIEAYVTRYAFMPLAIKLAVIVASALLMVFYFIIYPAWLNHHGKFQSH